jgi:hypothetical protein
MFAGFLVLYTALMYRVAANVIVWSVIVASNPRAMVPIVNTVQKLVPRTIRLRGECAKLVLSASSQIGDEVSVLRALLESTAEMVATVPAVSQVNNQTIKWVAATCAASSVETSTAMQRWNDVLTVLLASNRTIFRQLVSRVLASVMLPTLQMELRVRPAMLVCSQMFIRLLVTLVVLAATAVTARHACSVKLVVVHAMGLSVCNVPLAISQAQAKVTARIVAEVSTVMVADVGAALLVRNQVKTKVSANPVL